MSTMHMITAQSDLPHQSAIEEVAAGHGFQLAVEGLNWKDCNGCLPLRINGRQTGVEVYLNNPDELRDLLELNNIAGANQVVSCRFGDRSREEAGSSLVFLGALAQLTDGMVFDPVDGADWELTTVFHVAALGLKDAN